MGLFAGAVAAGRRLGEAGAEAFADRIERRLEGLGAHGLPRSDPGAGGGSPDDLEAMDENLVGGDLGGGSAHLDQQLFFRPAFPYFRHRTPMRGLYLASASTHPGAGVHGACGYNAARAVLHDHRSEDKGTRGQGDKGTRGG